MKTKIIILLVTVFLTQNIYSQSNFVDISGNQFVLNGSTFYPVAANYLVTITKNHTNNTYYLSPNWNYSNKWGYPNTGGNGRYIYSSYDDIGVSHNKLINDMSKMSSRNINVLRIVGFSIDFANDGSIIFPNNCSETVYFQKISELLNILQDYNLKAILLINAPINNPEFDIIYNAFLSRLASHFSTNTALMGYDFLNEPTTFIGNNQKYINSSRISGWHYSIKKNAPNHLTTIGYSYTISAIIDWDPLLHPVDFASFHIYAWNKNVQFSKTAIAAQLKWYSNTIKKPWIIGEIGFSGTNIPGINDDRVGTEAQQKDFADFTMQRALDCGCNGYTWWQFQEINWQNPWEDYLGLITNFDPNIPNNGENEKLVIQSFINFDINNINTSNCVKPSNYYNIDGNTYLRNYGRVVDNQGNPIKDAVIDRSGFTFTNENGYFYYYTKPTGNFYTLTATAPGYNVVKISNPSYNVGTIVLKPIHYQNGWIKKWSNNNNDKINEWKINNYDKFYAGDFDGDGIDELLCVQTGTNHNWMSLLKYENGNWVLKWSNYGTNHIMLPYRENFIIGDYDGDGKDEILGIDTKGWITMFSFSNNSWNWKWSDYGNHSISSYKDNMVSGDFDGDGKDEILGFNMNGWTTMFNFENNNFQWGWSDYGNNHSIRSYRENLIVGDFNGDGKDEILGNDIDNGWLTLFRFENGDFKWKWSNYGSNHMMLPYRNNLIVGNFDSDPADEILGIDTWATKFDFDNNNWSWNWSSEESSLLGDWIVNKNNNFLFLKADPSEPEYFMVLSQNTNHDFCNMYLKNPLPEANATYKMNKIFGTKETKKYISDNTNLSNDWVIYPNPSEGLFKISFNKREPDSQIKIYNQTGKLIKTIDNTQARELEIDLSNYPAGLYIVALKGTNSIQMKKIIKIK